MKVCSKCKETKSLNDFYALRSGNHSGYCKKCARESTRKWTNKHPRQGLEVERHREQINDWRRKNVTLEKQRDYHRKKRYDLSREEYERLPKECAICGSPDNLVLDHDHVTGLFRGVLCHRHNVGIGFFKDDPTMLLRAVDYLMGLLTPYIKEQVKQLAANTFKNGKNDHFRNGQ